MGVVMRKRYSICWLSPRPDSRRGALSQGSDTVHPLLMVPSERGVVR